MENPTLIEKIKEFISKYSFELFLWASELTKEQYLKQVVEQYRRQIEDEVEESYNIINRIPKEDEKAFWDKRMQSNFTRKDDVAEFLNALVKKDFSYTAKEITSIEVALRIYTEWLKSRHSKTTNK